MPSAKTENCPEGVPSAKPPETLNHVPEHPLILQPAIRNFIGRGAGERSGKARS